MFYVIEVAIFFFFFCFLLFSIYEIEDLIIIKIRGIKEQMISMDTHVNYVVHMLLILLYFNRIRLLFFCYSTYI